MEKQFCKYRQSIIKSCLICEEMQMKTYLWRNADKYNKISFFFIRGNNKKDK